MSHWQAEAACLYHDAELFFPVGTNAAAVLQADEAKTVCAGCDVRTECLDSALERGIVEGIWGGTTEEERKRMKRREARNRGRALVDADPIQALILDSRLPAAEVARKAGLPVRTVTELAQGRRFQCEAKTANAVRDAITQLVHG